MEDVRTIVIPANAVPADRDISHLERPASDAGFSERTWNTAILLYLQTNRERPSLN